MAKAFRRPAETWRYILIDDRQLPLEEQSRFTLRPLTHAERASVRDDLQREHLSPDGTTTIVSRIRQTALALALTHIVQIENFPSDAPQPWPADVASRRRYLEQLADDSVLEIGNEIWNRSALEGADGVILGNSLPPERISSSGGDRAVLTSTPAEDATRILS